MDRDALAEALASLTLFEASALVEALRARLGVALPHAPPQATLPEVSARGASIDLDAPRCACVEVTSWGEDPLAVARVMRGRLVVSIAELAVMRRRASATFECTLTWDQARELRRALAGAGAVAVVHLEALE
jgi:ribosomal protein L7/L12